MARKRLTATNVLTLPTKRAVTQYWDHGSDAAQGLAVWVSPSGVRTYRAVFYYPGSAKPHGMKLGRVGEMTLDEARDKTREARGLARRGLDPKQGDPAKSGDFKSAVETWTKQEQIGRKQNRSADDCERFMLTACKSWHWRPVASILYHEIEELLHVKRDYAPYAANRLHAHLATFFRWCRRTHRIQINPMSDMLKPWNGAKARDREWFKGEKADEMIKVIWRVATERGGDDEVFLKLLLITGKRKNAVRGMLQEQIMNSFWTPVPGSKTKRNHPIPLPRLAMKVLGSRKRAGLRVREGKLVAAIKQASGADDFLLHGIRHIVETKLAELKVSYEIRDALLDHAPVRGAGRGYDHFQPHDEMLQALEKWTAYITKLVSGKPARDPRRRSR